MLPTDGDIDHGEENRRASSAGVPKTHLSFTQCDCLGPSPWGVCLFVFVAAENVKESHHPKPHSIMTTMVVVPMVMMMVATTNDGQAPLHSKSWGRPPRLSAS